MCHSLNLTVKRNQFPPPHHVFRIKNYHLLSRGILVTASFLSNYFKFLITGSPLDDYAIMEEEEPSSDVVLNEINHRSRDQRSLWPKMQQLQPWNGIYVYFSTVSTTGTKARDPSDLKGNNHNYAVMVFMCIFALCK